MSEMLEHTPLETAGGAMRTGGVGARVREIVEPTLNKMGYTVVQISYGDGGRRASLQLMAERADLTPMSFDDCEQISRMAAALLDVEDPIAKAYNLEVVSPGPERPLLTIEDFTRFTGHDAKIELVLPRDGQRKFLGTIESVQGDQITFRTEIKQELFALREIRNARLIQPRPHLQSKPKRK